MGGKGVSSYNLADTIISAFMGTSDFIHILSLRARFLYASPVATRSLLEYDTMADFLGHELSEFVRKYFNQSSPLPFDFPVVLTYDQCLIDPADLISILRELRMTRLGDSINYLCRFRKKHSGYIYMEVSGHVSLYVYTLFLYSFFCNPVIPIKMFQGGPSNRKCFILSGRQINMCTFPKILLEPNSTDVIAKITSDGVILYIQPDCFKLFGIPSEKMLGRSLLDFVNSSDIESCVTSLLNCWNHSQIEKCSARICVTQAILPIHIDQQQQLQQHQKKNGVSHYAPANLQFLPSSKDSPQEATTLSRLFVRIQLLSSADPPGGTLSDIDFDTNLFEIMNETRSTSLHYELNQLRLQNLKLSEELDFLKKTRK
jgi:hypothetical protein